jgi:protein-L-isoaspartate O-methyltransferase
MSHMTATYSPDDNKLRLYSLIRLDDETYKRVKALGFRYAPKQDLFVAPAWHPQREDLLIELCGEITDEDTSLVQRAEERADRFGNYSDKRAQEAAAARNAVQAIGQRFEFGQPILVGHHSERKARKDAERMESGMRRAVSMWETSTYWKDRAAGALAHAKYKELPDVRARRIKTIEADKRKQERNIAEASAMLEGWQLEGLTTEQALQLASRWHSSRCYPLADFPRDPPASQYEGEMGLWSALDGGVITVEQARAQCLNALPSAIAWAQRWIDHYDNRLIYERAMLQEQGGLVAERFAIEVGGKVLVRGDWLTVLRVNKAGGRINSVTTNRRFVRVVGIEEVTDYQAPAAEVAEKVKAATKVAPLTNYPGEGFIHITQAEWNAIGKDYRGTETLAATAIAGRHRVRQALGVFLPRLEVPQGADRLQRANCRHHYHAVYITDAKRTNPPAAPVDQAQAPAVPAPAPAPAPACVPVAAPVAPTPCAEPNEFEKMRTQLRQGVAVQVVNAPQLFPTPTDLAARVVNLAHVQEGARVLEPSAGTGRLIAALCSTGKSQNIVAIEINRQLADDLNRRFGCTQTDSLQAVEVIPGDFLEIDAGSIGKFDTIVMNPPFASGSDVRHITHALTMLKPGGRLVAICANGPRQQAILRPLAEARGGEWENLPLGTFKDEGTGVNTALVMIPG